MADITTRGISSTTVTSPNLAKGSALTHNEIDSNFINLNSDKLENTSDDFTGNLSIKGSGASATGAVRLYDNDDTHYVDIKAPATVGTNLTYTLPASVTNGYVLTTDGSGTLSWTAKTVDTTDVVSDTSPQLGGDLDMNGQALVTTSNGDIELKPNGTGNVEITANVTEQYGGNKGLFIHDQSQGGYDTASSAYPGGFMYGPGMQIEGHGQYTFPSIILRNNSDGTASNSKGYNYIWAAKSRPSGGSDYDTDDYLDNDEIIFRYYGAPYNGAASAGSEFFTAGALCDFTASENHSSGNLGCKIIFGTIDNGSSTNTTKLTIDDEIEANVPFVLKHYTTTQRDALTAVEGSIIYNSTTNKAQVYNGSSWDDMS